MLRCNQWVQNDESTEQKKAIGLLNMSPEIFQLLLFHVFNYCSVALGQAK